MKGNRSELSIFQANTAKAPEAHDNALNYADLIKADVILIQEPWTTLDPARCRTKTHPAYSLYSSVQTWTGLHDRPRTLTYVRKDRGLIAYMLESPSSRDILPMKIHTYTIINAYRQPATCDILDTLYAMDITPKIIIAGDFNAHHCTWQPGITSNAGASGFVDWINNNNLEVYNPPGIPTHTGGNTLDLIMGNAPLVRTEVAPHLHTGSDHSTLLSTIPLTEPTPPPLEHYYLPIDKIEEYEQAVKENMGNLPSLIEDEEDAESFAIRMIALLTDCLKKVGRKRRPDGKSASWWNNECKETAAKCQKAIQENPHAEETKELKKEWRRLTRRAKRDMWEKRIQDIKDDKDLYKICGWEKITSQMQAVPIKTERGEVITDPLNKAEYLRKTLLERSTEEDDLSTPHIPTCPRRKISWDNHVPLREAEKALLGAGNTTPGSDGITVTMLRAAWPAIGKTIRYFFQQCLKLGYHPQVFRKADVVMIPKPGRDPSTHKGWRPISLLSCLGKGLERLIARRMAWLTLEYGILPPEVAGALPKKSAVDIVAALAHDVEAAIGRGKVCTLATIDVLGAFDAALHNRMVHGLDTQGWPPNICKWTQTFMTGRSATVTFEGVKTAPTKLGSLLPQGSPASPILFLLYLALAHTFGPPGCRFGYADDCGILAIGDNLEETTHKVQEILNKTLEWGSQNGIFFSPDKTELIHFSRKHSNWNLTIQHGHKTIAPQQYIKWLGIWLDRTFSFKHHIEERAAKALATANHIRGLSRVHKGAPPAYIHKAITTVVLPKLLYGSEIWWPGPTRHGARKRNGTWPQVQNGLMGQVSKCQVTLNHAIRGCLPIWKTTPIAALAREASIPPMEILLEIARRRHSLRLGSLFAEHPLVQRIQQHRPLRNRGNPARPTILTSASALVGSFPRPVLRPPTYLDGPAPSFRDKEEAAEKFKVWADSLPPNHTVVYTDGSRLSMRGDPHTSLGVGYGYAIYRDKKLVHAGCRPLDRAEVFDAEAEGAAKGVAKASELFPQDPITVCLDNSAVIYGLHGNPPASSQAAFLDYYDTARKHKATVRSKWAPGHMGIPGNEMADILAKRGASAPPPTDLPPTRSFIKRHAGIENRAAFATWWTENRPYRYQFFNLAASLKPTKELQLPRNELHHLLAARSGHGDFADYHEKFNHNDALLLCSCGKKKTPTHIFSCQKARRIAPWRAPEGGINAVLGTQWQSFINRARRTAFFTEVCPRS